MTTGTGIFLASIIIGLVLLYGHTKDRWKWFSIWKTVGVVVFFILLYGGIFIYRAINGWDDYWDWSLENFIATILSLIIAGVLAGWFIEAYDWVMQKVHAKKMKDKGGNEDDEDYSPPKSDWQYDEDYNQTISSKISVGIAGIILFGGAYLLYPYLKPIVSGWIN